MGILEGPDPDEDGHASSRCGSPKLGRFSPILRALFDTPPPQGRSFGGEDGAFTAPTVEEDFEELNYAFVLDPVGPYGDIGAAPAGSCKGNNARVHAPFAVDRRFNPDPGSDSDAGTAEGHHGTDSSAPRPQLLPRGLFSTIDFSHCSSAVNTPSSVNTHAAGLFSPGPGDDTATPPTSPSTPGPERPVTMLDTKAQKKPVWGHDRVSAASLPTEALLSWTVADALPLADLFVPEQGRHFSQVVERNYRALSRWPKAFPIGLFGEKLPWFCPVPVLPPSGLTRVNPCDYYPSPTSLLSTSAVNPVYLSTREAKLNLIAARLGMEVTKDLALQAASGAGCLRPIHIFVDMSNIIIGFYNQLKKSRGIPLSKRIIAPRFFFDGLSLILERNRAASKRVVAGSAVDAHSRVGWPPYIKDAEQLGYEMNILNRVAKPQSPAVRRFASRRSGNNSSSYSSDEDMASFSTLLRQGEQAVDEILHLKMCESLLDYDRSTIVLATGDAAEAEFSAGFLAQASRALSKGWHVELVTWKSTVSSAWQDLSASGQWGDRFRIIPLDWYVEELFDS